MFHYGRNNIWLPDILFLEFKTMVIARTLYVYAHILNKNTPLVCREFLSPGCAPRKKIIFSCPALNGQCTDTMIH
jgi:hypothetical protein